MYDLKNFTIRIASPEQKLGHARACYEIEPWRGGMTWDEFVAFCETESRCDWAKNNRAITWVLVKRDEYDGECYSFVETHRMDCFIKSRYDQSNGVKGEIKKDTWYNLTAVVTPIRHRYMLTDTILGNGYATHLIQLLHYVLISPSSPGDPPSHVPSFPIEQWGEPPLPISEDLLDLIPKGCASVLWADIPIEFYAKCKIGLDGKGYNYDPTENTRLTWSISHIPAPITVNNQVKSHKWEPIHNDSLKGISNMLSEVAQE
ncbi:uncharacterized protein IL334_001245 [Kwoniella shivajii]|uniref:Uncharacterized protein n=1 Tax=Kwoniella shivajii TaxID=564305 RepID=A0ABZ1CRD3_9TREE|nr:hypothetical protein IL334_001245 [Kwoniella shivajii]